MRKTLSLAAVAVTTLAFVAASVPPASAAVPPTPTVASTITTGLNVPWGLAFLPDGSALVSERNSAQIKRIATNGTVTTVGTVPGVVPGGEGGLHGLAVASTFNTDRFVYAYFTAANDNRIVRMTYNTTLGQPQVVFSGIPKAQIHNGGRLAFGPDGMLYASTGDAAVTGNAQNPNSPGGKILRLTPAGQPAPGNPVAGNPMFSLGHRNVQGLAFDAEGRLWASEFGQNTWDELNLIQSGRNYGWPTVEGQAGNPNFVDPVAQWTTAEASPSGIAFARNTIWMASLRGQRLWGIPVLNGQRDGNPVAFFNGQFGRLRNVAVAPDGALWLVTNETDGRGTPQPGDDRILRLTLSDPGPGPGPGPSACDVTYTPNTWSDGFTANVTIANTGTAAINGWSLAFSFGGNQRVTSSWGATVAQNGQAVTATNANWNGTIAPAASQSFGFQGTYSGTNTSPASFTLNGTSCS